MHWKTIILAFGTVWLLNSHLGYALPKTETLNKPQNNTSKLNRNMANDSTIIDSSFVIENHLSDSYKGVFKNGKPYNGYFKKNISEHVIVDYYKKGKQIYQYSNDYLKLLENEGSNGFEYNTIQTLDIESSYKEGEIYSGFAYIDNENSFTTKEIEKGKTKKIDIDVFAMHYFNRITIKDVDGAIEITTFDDENSKILIEKVMDTLTCKLVDKKVIAYKVNKVFNFQDLPKNSMIRSSIFQNEPLTIVMRIDKELENQSSCQELFRNISLFNFKDLDDFYTKFELANNEQNNSEKVALLIAYVMTDENSAIKNGIYWETTNGGQYHEYLKGSELKIESQTLEEFQKSIDNFFNKL